MNRAASDWNLGRYERIATGLVSAAIAVVNEAGPRAGDRVLDVGCGTGNAALLAAERGCETIGVDPAERLLAVARAEASGRNLPATFIQADAAAIPLQDGIADVVLSVFGVIFAPDPRAAAAELARVTAPGGRIVISAWSPAGTMADVMKIRRQAVATATGAPIGSPPFPWHDQAALESLFASAGFSLRVREHHLAFTGPSAASFLDAELRNHPLWIAAREVLDGAGRFRAVRDQALEILTTANEAPDGFRVTSRYVVATARRG